MQHENNFIFLVNKTQTYMMGQICIHNDDKIPLGMLQPMHIGCAQPQLLLSWPQDNFVFAVQTLQLLSHLQGAIRTAIVNHNDLIVYAVLVQIFDQKPNNDGKVFTLVVSRQKYGVFVWHL